jgi:hypothetical protein
MKDQHSANFICKINTLHFFMIYLSLLLLQNEILDMFMCILL